MGKFREDCDSKSWLQCLARGCQYAGALYFYDSEGHDPAFLCGKPQEDLDESLEKLLEIDGVRGIFQMFDKQGEKASIMILAKHPKKVPLPQNILAFAEESVI